MSKKKSDAIDFHEANFVSLRDHGQSNIYSLVHLSIAGHSRLVVATLRAQIFCLEYQKDSLRPLLTPINFTYIPADAEVISIDAFVREPNGVIFGVTLVKRGSDPKEVYFNLYGLHCPPSAPFHWDRVAEDWQPITLNFIPFQLMHTQILAGDHWEDVFLLSGDDLKVHLYRETQEAELSFVEEPSSRWFPELQDLPSSATYMDVRVVGDQRLSVVGCQNGYLRCAVVTLTSCKVVHSWWTKIVDGPISSVKIFSLDSAEPTVDMDKLHLVVGSALELGVIFLNVVQEGFNKSLVLPDSYQHDSVLAVEVADIDWDGENEIILGTFGKEILVYKLHNRDKDVIVDKIWHQSLAHRIHCMWYGDLTHDGLSELAIVSTGGVHILQHNIKQASAVCVKRLLATLGMDSEDKGDTEKSLFFQNIH